jgi:hypothetical protein
MNVTKDGIVETMEVNVVSPALLTSLLKPQMMAARKPRVVFVGSANCYDPLDWPATDLVESAVKWTTGAEPHPGTSQYYFYSFSKFVLAQYAAELAKQEPGLTTFTVSLSPLLLLLLSFLFLGQGCGFGSGSTHTYVCTLGVNQPSVVTRTSAHRDRLGYSLIFRMNRSTPDSFETTPTSIGTSVTRNCYSHHAPSTPTKGRPLHFSLQPNQASRRTLAL